MPKYANADAIITTYLTTLTETSTSQQEATQPSQPTNSRKNI